MKRFFLPKLFFFSALVLTSCSDKTKKKDSEAPAVPVHTASVEIRDVPLYFEAIGVIRPNQTVDVRPQVRGIIKKVHFTEGQTVKEGDLLYTIEEDHYAIKVKELEALLAQDEANLASAQKKLQRYQSLHEQDLIPKIEWDEIETKVALYSALVKANQARLEAAKLDLQKCKIVAPLSGKIGKTALQAGNMVGEAPLVTIVQLQPLFVDFSITEKELQKLSNSSHGIEVFSLEGEESLASGKLTFLNHSLDTKSGMLLAKGVLTKTEKNLWAGQSVRVHLLFGKKEKAKLIPLKAIKTNQDGAYVFSVKEDNTVEMTPVKLGFEEHGFIIVEEGLGSVEKVVTEGHLRLFPGSKVEEAAE